MLPSLCPRRAAAAAAAIRTAVAAAPVSTPRCFSTLSHTLNQTPWYLNPDESPKISSPLKHIQLPKLPDNHPPTLESLTNFLATELGIDDLSVFDMRHATDKTIGDNGAYDIADFMVIGTGKSSKHLLKASSQLNFFIKHNLHKLPLTEGLLKNGKLAQYHRKLQRKGKKAPNYSKNTYGVNPNTWIMTDTKTDGIYIHMLTNERRLDLNLESLWTTAANSNSNAIQPNSINNNINSDNILLDFRRFIHSSTETSVFNPLDLSNNNYMDQLYKLLNTHLVDINKVSLSNISHHINLMYSAGIKIDKQSLLKILETAILSDELNKTSDSLDSIFNKRSVFISKLIHNYNIQLSNIELLEILPSLIVSAAQFNNPNFITVKSAINNPHFTLKRPFTYSKVINDLFNLSNDIKFNAFSPKERDLKRKIDILLLTVFTNHQMWSKANILLNNAIIRNDLAVVKAALPLVNACATQKHALKFYNDFLPLIIEAGLDPELEIHSQLLHEKVTQK